MGGSFFFFNSIFFNFSIIFEEGYNYDDFIVRVEELAVVFLPLYLVKLRP